MRQIAIGVLCVGILVLAVWTDEREAAEGEESPPPIVPGLYRIQWAEKWHEVELGTRGRYRSRPEGGSRWEWIGAWTWNPKTRLLIIVESPARGDGYGIWRLTIGGRVRPGVYEGTAKDGKGAAVGKVYLMRAKERKKR